MKAGRWQLLWRDERDASAIEIAFLAPNLRMVLMGTATLFDLFRNAQNAGKSTFTIEDILSRQASVNDASLDALLSLMRHTVTTADDAGLRISSITRKDGKLILDWSKIVGATASVGSSAIPSDVVLDLANGDSIILTESFVPHSAMVAALGLDVTFQARAVHGPRFVGTIVFAN